MENMQSAVENLVHSSNTLFILLGAVMVLAMHAGFAFLEVGTVRQKNQVNALSKILSDFAVSTLAYFFIGYWISYGVTFLQPVAVLSADHGYSLVKFFFLLTFAAAIPAIISGGIAERARFAPQLCATVLIVAFVYPFFEGLIWNGNFGLQAWLQARFGASFHDFAGSDLMHPVGALATGAIAGALFVWCFTAAQGKWKIDDVLGVWPLHGLCGVWGGIACGVFGQSALGGLGGVSLISQLIGTALGVVVALAGGFAVYGVIKAVLGLRLTQEEEYYGADLSIHKIGAVSQD